MLAGPLKVKRSCQPDGSFNSPVIVVFRALCGGSRGSSLTHLYHMPLQGAGHAWTCYVFDRGLTTNRRT